MKEIKIKYLPREKFNEYIKLLESMDIKLGIKNYNGVVEYTYIDKNKTKITIVCDE